MPRWRSPAPSSPFTATPEPTSIRPLERLWELEGLPSFDLPERLARLYGGPLGFDEPRVFANFVSTIDGVVAIPSVPRSNRLIAAGSEADRFVLGLLRACADVLVIGSGTLAASPRSTWSPAEAFPDAAADFAELRRRLGRPERLEVAVLTRSGRLDPAHPAFAAGAVAVTTDDGAAELGRLLPAESLLTIGEELDPVLVTTELEARGHRLILCEGGPHAIGPFLERRLVDELFLTLSPLLTGRGGADPRLSLVEGTDLLPGGPLAASLLGIRQDEDHVFLRYRLDGATA
jgi:riboflavin biosynthesis pyrimidine reductase